METEKLRVLFRVLESGSLSAAAEALGYTPSGVSRILAALEEETGFPLLLRGRRGVTPTAACQELLPQLRRLLQAEQQLRQQIAAVRGLEEGSLVIGSSYGSRYRDLAALAAGFCRAHPGIRVDVFAGSSTELARAVEEGRSDLCVISRRDGSFDWLPLRQDPLVAVLPADHPCAGASAYPLARFAQDPFIEILPGQETDNSRCFRRAGVRPNTRYRCADDGAALSLVEAGLGVTMINAISLENWRGQAAVLPLDPPQTVEIGVAVPSLDAASPAARRFLAWVRERL